MFIYINNEEGGKLSSLIVMKITIQILLIYPKKIGFIIILNLYPFFFLIL